MASDTPPLLTVEQLSSRYGRVNAVMEIDLHVDEGELVAIVGANGAGKSTLLRAISGVQPISAGRVLLDGGEITRTAPHKRTASGIGHVPEGRQVFASLPVEDNLLLGGYPVRKDAAWIEEGMGWIYDMFPILKEKRHDLAGTLSGGQQQMLAIGRALMGRPRLLLLDEPSMGLAPLLVEEILRVIRKLNQEGTTCLLVEQNARAALAISSRAYVLEVGRVTLSGPSDELAANEAVRAAYLGH